MHLRIIDVTLSPARIDELGDVLSNKSLPVLREQPGFQGLICAADRATGSCAIVGLWDSKEALDASDSALATMRSETMDAVDAQQNRISIAEVLREVRDAPSRAGSRTRVVRLTAPPGSAGTLLDFYENEVLPRLQSQTGFLSARLIRDVDDESRFAAVSHWADQAALDASEQSSAGLRERVPSAVEGASIERVSTGEIIFIDLTA